ncbi:HEAT repeat domain-containing protein [Haliangium sp.]|uniref:HEAT repeat domain-containing protein n=1 Tax=Haliangium sp. TaxID=2663208 RepID=UPI003D127657
MGWPPGGTEVSRWEHSARVPSFELYLVADGSASPWGAARKPDSEVYLKGRAAFDAVREDVGDGDARLLAGLAMLFLDDDVAGQEPWTEVTVPDRVPAQQAIAEPPSLSGNTLQYWRFHAQLADLVRCRANLDSGEVQCTLGGEILRERALAADPMAVIEQELAADDIYARIRGIEQLARMGTDEGRQRLYDAALNQGHFQVREAAVNAIAESGGEGATATLSRILLFDGHAKVRRAAAVGLGALGDPAAREALEKAAKGDADGRVRGEAEYAMTRLR